MNDKADFLYATMDVAIWSCAETAIGIIASSAATFRPLFKKFLDKSRYAEGSHPLKAGSTWHQASHMKHGYVRSTSPDAHSQKELMIITKATTVDITNVRGA